MASCSNEHNDALSRAGTMESALNELCEPLSSKELVTNWALRPASANSAFLRDTFRALVAESESVEPDQRLVMYDACDEHEVVAPVGSCLRKRLDARRDTKPKKPDTQRLVCTPFDPNGFNFTKIKNDRERLLRLSLAGGQYEILTNKFPLFAGHMLLVSRELVPQQIRAVHLRAISELLAGCTGFSAYFNSWCASASVNHFHCHLVDEQPPVTRHPLVPGPHVLGARCLVPEGFPGFCFVFETSQLESLADVIIAMQQDNQPHNLLFSGRHVYVFPKPLERPERSFELYPETVGGPELIGSFTVYNQDDYEAITLASAEELCRMNTAPLPSRVLRRGADAPEPEVVVDDSTLGTRTEASVAKWLMPAADKRIPGCRSVDAAGPMGSLSMPFRRHPSLSQAASGSRRHPRFLVSSIPAAVAVAQC